MTPWTFLAELASSAVSVLEAVLPLTAFFIIFQILFLRLPRQEVSRIIAGTLIASLGLLLFLVGVQIGFLPFGRAIGEALASLPEGAFIALGMLLGFVTTWGEPAVRILAGQVEEASSGSIGRVLVLYAICVAVAIAVGLGLFRIAHAMPLLWLLVPGYALVLAAMWVSDKAFVSIAIDAGGVATGPLANSFLLALALGAASAMGGRDPLVHGLGLVSLIALAPIIALTVLGLLVRLKTRTKES
jgi:hypothetical protein